MKNDHAMSEIISVILIILMILILAIVVTGLLLGANIFQQKSALVALDIRNQTLYNKNVITVFHRAGDEVYLNSSLTGLQELGIYIDNKTFSWRAQPVLGLNTVKPGAKLFIYYNTSRKTYRITTNAATLSTNEAQPVVDCPLKIRLVDERAHLLISTWNWTCIPVPPTGPAPTVAAITNTTGYRGWPVIESITGTNFLNGATAKFNRTGSPDIPASSCTYVSSIRMNCTFDLSNKLASPPNYNIVVTNPDGKAGMRANYFTLSNPVPTITSSTPVNGSQAATVSITNLTGTRFQPGAIVDYYLGGTRINLTGVNVVSPIKITGTLTIPPTAPAGLYGISVTNPNSTPGVQAGRFTVISTTPTVASVTNTTGYRGWPVIERITGTNFVSGATSKLNRTGNPDIPATSCTYVSATQLICSFDLLVQNASPPNYNVVVTNPDGRSGMRANYFVLSSPAPTITSSTPASGVRGTTVPITNLLGSYFQPGATVTYWRGATSIPVNPLAVPLRTQITGSLAVPVAAPTGAYNITVLNTDGKTVTRANAFTVYANPPPTITGIVPGSGVRVVAVPVVVTGTNIQAGARVRLYNGTTAVYLAPVGTVTPPNQISTTFSVPLTVIPGTMNVRITNTDGQYATLTGGYILLP